MSNENASRAVKMFSGILKYQGDTAETVSGALKFEIAQKLLHQGLKRPELKNELFMQLVKQTRGNPSAGSCLRAWELFHVVAATMPPSKVCMHVLFHACMHCPCYSICAQRTCMHVDTAYMHFLKLPVERAAGSDMCAVLYGAMLV